VVSVKRVPVSCIPSPESPANRITTLSKFFVLILNLYIVGFFLFIDYYDLIMILFSRYSKICIEILHNH